MKKLILSAVVVAGLVSNTGMAQVDRTAEVEPPAPQAAPAPEASATPAPASKADAIAKLAEVVKVQGEALYVSSRLAEYRALCLGNATPYLLVQGWLLKITYKSRQAMKAAKGTGTTGMSFAAMVGLSGMTLMYWGGNTYAQCSELNRIQDEELPRARNALIAQRAALESFIKNH